MKRPRTLRGFRFPETHPMLFRTAAVALVCALAAAAESPAPSADDPRPGMRWDDRAPESGGRRVTLLVNGREIPMTDARPGDTVKAMLPGENRLLVDVRRNFDSRTSEPAPAVVFWKLDDGPETRVELGGAPHRTALYLGMPDAVPGTRGFFIVEAPSLGVHTVTVRVPEDAAAGVSIRFQVEEPKRLKGLEGGSSKASAHKDSWWMQTWTRLRLGYDDNVWRFNDETVHDFEERNTNHPTDRYDRMQSVEDWYLESEFDLDIISPEGPLGQFTIGAGVTDTFYLDNHRKNTDELRGSLKHQPFANFWYKVFGSWTVDKFVRNYDLFDVPGTQRAHAHYDDYEIGVRAWYALTPRLRGRFTYTWELHDWNSNFNERDQKLDRFDVQARWSPAKAVTFELGYEYTHARALAKGDEPDTSYEQHEPRIGVEFEVQKLLFGVSYRYAAREYTTGNSGTTDPLHADRRDRKHTWKVYAGVKVGESSSLVLEYTRTKKTSHVPGRQSAGDLEDLDDLFEHDANTFELTFSMPWP